MRLLSLFLTLYCWPTFGSSLVEEPEHCLSKNVRPCAIKNILSKPYQVQLENVEVSLSSQGILWVDVDSVRLVRGESLLTVKKTQAFETAYAKVEIHEGIALVRIFDSMEIDLIDGAGKMWIKGDDSAQDMTPGFHWSVGGIGRRGIASIEVPQSSVFKSVVKAWAALNFAPKSEFYEKVEEFRKRLVTAVVQSSELNQNLARKMVEVDETAKRNAARKQEQIEAENKLLRGLYRRKNNMD